MDKKPVHSVFFSPTGTTRTVIRSVCRGTGWRSGIEVDLNRPVGGNLFFAVEDPVIIGMPVYAGRLPRLAVERFASVRGSETPAVAVVVYGNRAYDDALLELRDLCTAQGFRVIAAAAFIGEHSFSSPAFPIANGRPDAADLQRAEQFGQQLSAQKEELYPDHLPGTRPYKPAMIPDCAAADSDLQVCTRCGQCANICPAGAITYMETGPQTDAEKCIWCSACVKSCPAGARRIILPKIREIAERLHITCQTRKEPELFFA